MCVLYICVHLNYWNVANAYMHHDLVQVGTLQPIIYNNIQKASRHLVAKLRG